MNRTEIALEILQALLIGDPAVLDDAAQKLAAGDEHGAREIHIRIVRRAFGLAELFLEIENHPPEPGDWRGAFTP
jgi:hypothetical protein